MNREKHFKERFLYLLGEDTCRILKSNHPDRIHIQAIIDYNPKTKWCWISNHNIWMPLYMEYEYSNQKIRQLIREALKEHFKIEQKTAIHPEYYELPLFNARKTI